MIKTFLAGRLCADPELRTTTSGHSVCNMRLAVRTSQKDAQGQAVSEFYTAVAWSGLADTCAKYLKKGSLVYVTGEPRKREYTGKDGAKHTDMEINVENLEFGPASVNANASVAGSAPSRTSPPPSANGTPSAASEEDLPF